MIGWIVPPSEDAMNYMINVHNLITHESNNVFRNLGDITTPFELGSHILNKITNGRSTLEILRTKGHIDSYEFNKIGEALRTYQTLKDNFQKATDSNQRASAWAALRKFLIVDQSTWTEHLPIRSNVNSMSSLLHRLLYPKWANDDVTPTKTDYNNWIRSVFESYTAPIYYRL